MTFGSPAGVGSAPPSWGAAFGPDHVGSKAESPLSLGGADGGGMAVATREAVGGELGTGRICQVNEGSDQYRRSKKRSFSCE